MTKWPFTRTSATVSTSSSDQEPRAVAGSRVKLRVRIQSRSATQRTAYSLRPA